MPQHGRGAFPKAAVPTTWLDDGASARIKEYRVLRGMRDADKALALLRRIGSIVRPIMLKHGWRASREREHGALSWNADVPCRADLTLLIEMLPSNPALLGGCCACAPLVLPLTLRPV